MVARLPGILVLGLALFSACRIEESGQAVPLADAGQDATTGIVGTGTCFPGAKVCPNDKGELVCLGSNSPETGCQLSSACTSCAVPEAIAGCSADGKCNVAGCVPGRLDCNADPGDGCETTYEKDPSHCGSCENDCIALKGPGWLCESSTCVENGCKPSTTADCDADPSKCEVDLTTDAQNCSFCGNVCKLPHAQSECKPTPSGNPLAVCAVKTCDPGWFNCDGNDANGCESSSATDPSSCGGCGKKCDATNGVPGCSNGVCGILCNTGFANCDNNADNGCEVSLSFDPLNCGTCGSQCPTQGGIAVCNSGLCSVGTCNSGLANCDGNDANGCEVDIVTNPLHCGGCGKACKTPAQGSATCSGGKCGFTCNSGFAACGTDDCHDISSDPTRCGATCQQCPAPPTGHGQPACASGSCTFTCDPGYTACGGGCYDLTVDKQHCGSCTTVCSNPPNGTNSCVGGQCVPSCNANYTACGNSCVDLKTSNNHCGGCGKKCNWPGTCKNGACECPFECCAGWMCSSGYCCLGVCCG